jgi:hypothetical protein
MARKISIAAVVLLVIVAGLLVLGELVVKRRSETICGICNRPIQANLGVIAEVGERERRVCCARCAITEARQEGKPLRLVSVTDYVSGKRVAPSQAWYVEDSRAFACNHDMGRMDESKHAQQLSFDRCSPGTFAFAKREEADQFVANNGGVVRRLEELLGEVKAK